MRKNSLEQVLGRRCNKRGTNGLHRSEGTQCEPTASGAPAGRQEARRAMDGYCRQPRVWRAFCFVGWTFTRVGLRETKRLSRNEWKRIVGEQKPKI